MSWKSVTWAGCLLPVLTGCGSMYGGSPSVASEVGLNHTRRGLDRESRRDALNAWETVVIRYPHTGFTDEFRDGFLDGYAECRDHGAVTQTPAALPPQFARDKKYLTPEGQSLVRDYTLGFKYGIDVAGGPRPSPDGTGVWNRAEKPAPDAPPAPRAGDRTAGNKSGDGRKPDQPVATDTPLPVPGVGSGLPVPPLPKPEVPVIKPFNPELSGSKFAPLPVPPNPDLLPIPSPPLPTIGSRIEPLPTPPLEPKRTVPLILEPFSVPVPPLQMTRPSAPDEAQDQPTHPLPLILRDLPLAPFRPAPPPDSNALPSQK